MAWKSRPRPSYDHRSKMTETNRLFLIVLNVVLLFLAGQWARAGATDTPESLTDDKAWIQFSQKEVRAAQDLETGLTERAETLQLTPEQMTKVKDRIATLDQTIATAKISSEKLMAEVATQAETSQPTKSPLPPAFKRETLRGDVFAMQDAAERAAVLVTAIEDELQDRLEKQAVPSRVSVASRLGSDRTP